MKTQFEWRIAPHPISALSLKNIAGTQHYVSDGKGWVKAFYDNGEWCYGDTNDTRLGISLQPQPTHFLTPVAEDPQAGSAEPRAGWDCGNRGLAARYLLLLIERNPHLSVDQLEWIHDMIDQAGPGFSQARLDFHTNDEVPF